MVEIHKKYPKAIKIMLTGQAALESAVKAINEADLYRYLIKPWEEEDFLLTVEQGLKKYSMDAMLGELAKALQLREDLINTIVHDIRTPLNLIQGYSELLLMQGGLPQEYSDYLEEVQKQTNRLNTFTNDLLMLAKMENNQFTLNKTLSDPKQIVTSLGKTYQIVANSHRMNLVVQVPEKNQEMLLDQNLFQRVVENLLNNAFKYSPPETTIMIQLEFLEGEKTKLRLKVADQGPGIPAEHKRNIFEKFKIVELKKKGVAQIGLGLAFCKMVVHAHGGKIFLEDNQPHGCIFVVEI